MMERAELRIEAGIFKRTRKRIARIFVVKWDKETRIRLMTTRFGSIGERIRREEYLANPVTKPIAVTYKAVNDAISMVLYGNSPVNVRERNHVLDGTTTAIGNTIRSLREGKFIRALGDGVFGIADGVINDGIDAVAAKKSLIVESLPERGTSSLAA
jgi:hypothetical protein